MKRGSLDELEFLINANYRYIGFLGKKYLRINFEITLIQSAEQNSIFTVY